MAILLPLMRPVFQQPSSPHSSSWKHCNHNLHHHSVTPLNSISPIHVTRENELRQRCVHSCMVHLCGGLCVLCNVKICVTCTITDRDISANNKPF